MKVALVHDSFTQMGGAERVVDALHELFPEAPVFTLAFDPKYKEKYKGWDIRTSAIQPLYLALGKLQYTLPLITYGVDSLDFTGFDLVISSSSGFVKNIRVPKGTVHINYCHTPTRFLWIDKNYVSQEVPWYQRPFVYFLLKHLKRWDYNGAQRVTEFVANSIEVQKRIKEHYNRDSKLVYPFVDDIFWPKDSAVKGLPDEKFPNNPKLRGNYFLLAGRLQPHKNNELIIEIFNELGVPLHVVGSGRQEAYLKSIANGNIEFFGRVSDNELIEQYKMAKAYIYPQVEDFGLMPLEAAASGTPTIAYEKGGTLETIVPGVTGEFFKTYDKQEIKNIISNFDPDKYKQSDLARHAAKFSKENFKTAILNLLSKYENRV